MSDLATILSQEQAREKAESDAFDAKWALGDYTGESCPECGRQRLCRCPNGKSRCEKCNWSPEEKRYVTLS